MTNLSPRARALLADIRGSASHGLPLSHLFPFSPAEGSVVDQKHEARSNAEALEELIRAGLAHLWIIDKWPEMPAAAADLEVDEEIELDPEFVARFRPVPLPVAIASTGTR